MPETPEEKAAREAAEAKAKTGQESVTDPAPGDAGYWKKQAQEHGKEAQNLRAKLKAEEDAKAKQAEEEAKKRGEFERLHAEEKAKREALEAEVNTFRASQQAELDGLLSKMDDRQKAIVGRSGSLADKLATAKDLSAVPAGQGGPSTRPPGSRDTGAKSVKEMTPAELEQYKSELRGGRSL